jgi:hypothetical protein
LVLRHDVAVLRRHNPRPTLEGSCSPRTWTWATRPTRRCWPPAIGRVQKLFDRVVRAATEDRGYGEAMIEQELHDLGVTTVVMPGKGRPAQARRQVEHGRGFRRLVTGAPDPRAASPTLRRRYGWDRTLFDTLAGAQTWCGLGVLAHNRVKIAQLIYAHQPHSGARPARPRPGRTSAPDPVATGPPPDRLFHAAA